MSVDFCSGLVFTEMIDLQQFDNRAGAIFSPDRKYRYRLWRMWDADKPVLAFIMLNPSQADSQILDATVRRCIDFAKRWGYGTLEVGNIFALKSTDPSLLYSTEDPIGPDNDQAILDIYQKAELTIAAWGSHGAHLNRGKEVLRLIPCAKCLVQTKDGQPGHPLYLKSDLKPVAIKPIS